MTLKLYGTPRSHFTRVVRMQCAELGLDHEWVDVGNVGDATPFGGNPLMRVPVLVDGELSLWEADAICRYLVEREGRDPLGVGKLSWADENLVGVVRGMMSAEVQLVLAARSGLEPVGRFFDKARRTIEQGMKWLETRLPVGDELSYPGVWMIAMWDHVQLYELLPTAPQLAPNTQAFVARFREHPSVAPSRPQ